MPAATTPPASVERLQERLTAQSPGEHFYVVLLGLSVFDTAALRDSVEAGFPYGSVEQIQEALDIPTARIAELIRVPPRTLARRKDADRMQPEESDRLLRLARIVGLTLRLFEGHLDEARRWLFLPHRALGDEAPLNMGTTDVGAREVEHLIGRLEHGIPL